MVVEKKRAKSTGKVTHPPLRVHKNHFSETEVTFLENLKTFQDGQNIDNAKGKYSS